ncbi:putative Pentatricopeptide repeat-containing protein [Zostera marina]|uniref:Putative Pentatricopeptide repeat-containing protein n=1 Tax=Zostera marina TaxID=29655 RepID=A0A0K9Q4X8_ZOSMR|nr:putative Pentatricopeptide repeat-containing protein [Zostera marina]
MVRSISRVVLLPFRRLSLAPYAIQRTPPPRSALSIIRSTKDPKQILQILQSFNRTAPSPHHLRIALTAAVTNLAAANSPSSIRSILSHLPPDDAIVLFAKAGMLDAAHEVFLSTTPTLKTLSAFLFAHIVTKNYKQVYNLFRKFSLKFHITLDIRTYNTVITGLCHDNSSRSVFSLLDEMWRKGVKPNAISYNTLIAGLYREGKLEDVNRVLQMMKNNHCSIGISTVNTRIQSLCKLRRTKEARELLEKTISKGMNPNSVTYHHLIHGLCGEGDLEEANRIFDEMVTKGCVADDECYFTMIYYLCKAGEFEKGLRFCRESMDMNWVPKFSIMKTLIDGLARCGKFEEARNLLEDVKMRFPASVRIWREVKANVAKHEFLQML